MDEPGILVYGFDDGDAQAAVRAIASALGRPVQVLSASGREYDTVGDILETPSETFTADDTRVLMFLGFEGDQIRSALSAFPKDIKRPIFCGLTEHNIEWTFRDLLEHLREEHERTTRRQ